MEKRKMHFSMVLLCVLVGFIAMYFMGYRVGSRMAYESEFNVYHGAILPLHETTTDPRLHEFIKARYYNLARYVSDGCLRENILNVGVPNEAMLKGLPTGEGPVIPMDDYREFVKRTRSLR